MNRMPSRRRLPTLALVVGTALVVMVGLAACSDEGSSTSTSTTAVAATADESASSSSSTSTSTIPADPAQAAFVAQANPFCVTRNERIVAAAKSLTVPDAAGALAKRARFSIEATDKIRELTPPPGDEDEVAALLAAMDQANQTTVDLATAVLYADPDAGRAAAAALHEQLPVLNEQLVAYGLGDCVLDPPTG